MQTKDEDENMSAQSKMSSSKRSFVTATSPSGKPSPVAQITPKKVNLSAKKASPSSAIEVAHYPPMYSDMSPQRPRSVCSGIKLVGPRASTFQNIVSHLQSDPSNAVVPYKKGSDEKSLLSYDGRITCGQVKRCATNQ